MTSPSESGLFIYSCWKALVEMVCSMRRIRSSVFFSGQVERPSASRMFTISQWSAVAPARVTQQSRAMTFPQNTTSRSPLTDRVGIRASSNHCHFFFTMSGLRQSASVSKSSGRIVSGRKASLRVPRGDSIAPSARNAAPEVSENSSAVQLPASLRSP